MKRWTLWLAGAAALVVGLVACPQFAPDDVCGYPGFCADSSSGDGGGDAGDASVTCPSGKEPKDDPTCVSDTLGIFVAPTPTGNDSNAGTKASPVATLTTALQKAKTATKSFIFVCEGNYTESVDITQSAAIYGGFKCADWSYSGTLPKFTATKSDYVVHLDGANNTTIADLELDAIGAPANTGKSSVGVFATNSSVSAKRISINAAAGANGVDGILTQFSYPTQATLNGNSADGGTGGAENAYSGCSSGGTTIGGKGGDNGFSGDAGMPTYGDGGLGGIVGQPCNGTGTGGDGLSGPPGSAGVGATSAGSLDQVGWHASPGTDGKAGSVGQGGGGGQGVSGGAGGGGGAGACGGAGGGGGGGGGGSIGIVAFDSSISFNASNVRATDGGNGGNGVAGQNGQSPGGAHGNSAGLGCSGGNGGNGGNGGGGAGGAGGVSVGVLSKGGTITIDSATQSNITVAPKGGNKGTGAAGNDGIDGLAQATLAL